MLIRVYPVNSFAGETSPAGSGLSGIVRAIVAVRDLDRARTVYEGGFGLACDAPRDDDARSVRGFLCRPPSGGVIEFVSPSDPGRPFAGEVAMFLDEREGLYALALRGAEPRSVTACGTRIIVERPERP